MGDGKSSGSQQVDTYYLKRAADEVEQLARDFTKDISSFKSGMKNYSLDTLDEVSAERAKRIRGKDYDKSVAEQDGFQHAGATSDWLNPFGRFTEADEVQGRVDQVHKTAIDDGESLGQALDRLAGALRAAALEYERNEGKNSALSKKEMQQLLTGMPAGEKA